MKTIEQVKEYLKEQITMINEDYAKGDISLGQGKMLALTALADFINQEDEDNEKPASNI